MRRFPLRGALALGALLVLPFLAACDGIFGTDDVLGDQLRFNERKWADAGPPAAYRMELEVFRGGDTTAVPVRIHVRNGAVESAFYAGTDEPVPQSQWANYPPVEGVFALIRDALSRRVSGMGVNYDETYGFPREVGIDYDFRRQDDDIYLLATEFALE